MRCLRSQRNGCGSCRLGWVSQRGYGRPRTRPLGTSGEVRQDAGLHSRRARLRRSSLLMTPRFARSNGEQNGERVARLSRALCRAESGSAMTFVRRSQMPLIISLDSFAQQHRTRRTINTTSPQTFRWRSLRAWTRFSISTARRLPVSDFMGIPRSTIHRTVPSGR